MAPPIGATEEHPAPPAETPTVVSTVLNKLGSLWGTLLVLLLLYLFLVSITLLGAGFKVFGKGFARTLIATTANPFVGLFIGILATSLIQSSSTVTSMVVAFVAAGTLTTGNAVPIIMGANIGTTVTNTLVSLAHMGRRNEFRRALSAATVHDFFNTMAVAILLPLEIATHFLQRTAEHISLFLLGSSSLSFHSPIKLITKPPVAALKGWFGGLGGAWTGTLLVVLGLVLLFVSLYLITKVMRALLITRLEAFFQRTVGGSGVLGILMGLVITVIVQSSSVTTSLLIPMAAAGALTVSQVFPITLGANLGTTVTALLAALAGNAAGLTIALCHLLFNLIGTLLVYPIPFIRRIPIRLSERLGTVAAKSRGWAVAWVLGLFFVLPGSLIFVSRFF